MKNLTLSFLLISVACSIVAINDTNEKEFTRFTYDQRTEELSYPKSFGCAIGSQCNWSRSPDKDMRFSLPWSDGKKLEVNVSNILNLTASVVPIYLAAVSANKEYVKPHGNILDPKINSGAKFCVLWAVYSIVASPVIYHFVAGQQKWPFRVIDQEETTAK